MVSAEQTRTRVKPVLSPVEAKKVSVDRAKTAARLANERFGKNTVVIDVGGLLSVCDVFVITSGANARQVKAICEAVEDGLSSSGAPKPRAIEGLDSRSWVLMDYGDLIVHVFLDKVRDFYQLERLWGDCPRLSVG